MGVIQVTEQRLVKCELTSEVSAQFKSFVFCFSFLFGFNNLVHLWTHKAPLKKKAPICEIFFSDWNIIILFSSFENGSFHYFSFLNSREVTYSASFYIFSSETSMYAGNYMTPGNQTHAAVYP